MQTPTSAAIPLTTNPTATPKRIKEKTVEDVRD
jgi:hypothetical protein